MPGASRIIAGAMSGTSADGVDVALTRIDGMGLAMQPRLLGHHHHDYPSILRQAIFELRGSAAVPRRSMGAPPMIQDVGETAALRLLADLARQISLCYVAAVKEALAKQNLNSADLIAIAAHGQTLFHAPPNTIQWLDPALLAYETNCAVVSDFRRADCAAGGQGAPLVPFADFLLFRDARQSRVTLNLGGIANITILPAGAKLSDVTAFDTGPANCVSDWLCRTFDPTGPGYDANGQRAMRGKVIGPILKQLLADPFFSALPPKSTDTPAMISLFERAMRQTPNLGDPPNAPQAGRLNKEELLIALDDLLATACHWSASAIARAIPHDAGLIIASGGGVENQCMMAALRQYCPIPIQRTDDFGVPSPAREAMAFALLGAATLDNQPANVPSVTGACRPVVLGSITPKP